MINPVHLRTLGAVVRTGSFATAAKELGYTSSAVSQQMSALERDVRMRLFDRHARSVRPTPAAELLVRRAARALALLDGLEADVRSMAEGRLGHLRIGSFPTASEYLLPTAIAEIARRLPEVSIELEEGEPDRLLPLVSDRVLDLALVYAYDTVPRAWPREVRRTTVFSEDLVLMVPEDHRLSGSAALGDLREESWISTTVGTGGSACLHRLCGAEGFVPKVDFRTNDYDVVRSLVGAGLGVALVPRLGAQPGPGTRAVRLRDCTARRQVIAVRRRVDPSPAVEPALSTIVGVARQRMPEPGPDEGKFC